MYRNWILRDVEKLSCQVDGLRVFAFFSGGKRNQITFRAENKFSERSFGKCFRFIESESYLSLPRTVMKRSCQTLTENISTISAIESPINLDEISISLYTIFMKISLNRFVARK